MRKIRQYLPVNDVSGILQTNDGPKDLGLPYQARINGPAIEFSWEADPRLAKLHWRAFTIRMGPVSTDVQIDPAPVVPEGGTLTIIQQVRCVSLEPAR